MIVYIILKSVQMNSARFLIWSKIDKHTNKIADTKKLNVCIVT